MQITIDSVMALRPCSNWTKERVQTWFAGRPSVPVQTALLDPYIPIEDRTWLGFKLLDERRQRLFACDCAERILTRIRAERQEPNPSSWEAIAVARRHANDEADDEELINAGNAAGAHHTGTARAVSIATTRLPAWLAALETSNAASDGHEVNWYEERKWQLNYLIEKLEKA